MSMVWVYRIYGVFFLAGKMHIVSIVIQSMEMVDVMKDAGTDPTGWIHSMGFGCSDSIKGIMINSISNTEAYTSSSIAGDEITK